MEKQVMQEVGELIKLGKEGIMKAVAILQEQCPLLVSEIYKWEAISHIVSGTTFLCAGIFCTYAIAKLAKKQWVVEDEFGEILSWIGCIGIGLFCYVGSLVDFMVCVKIYIAPRLFLISYISNMVK